MAAAQAPQLLPSLPLIPSGTAEAPRAIPPPIPAANNMLRVRCEVLRTPTRTTSVRCTVTSSFPCFTVIASSVKFANFPVTVYISTSTTSSFCPGRNCLRFSHESWGCRAMVKVGTKRRHKHASTHLCMTTPLTRGWWRRNAMICSWACSVPNDLTHNLLVGEAEGGETCAAAACRCGNYLTLEGRGCSPAAPGTSFLSRNAGRKATPGQFGSLTTGP